jgi:two-component system, LytTR family, sensor kinase
LARKKSDHLESAIIQLSQLMRYSLYHTEKKVSLENEAEYISNYIELQRIRFGSKVTLHYHVAIERKDLMIEPMLLIPFVENAFKHGTGMIQNPVINVTLEASTYGIHVNVRNKFNPSEDTKDTSSGIGLQNVKRRLDLLYKDLYALKTYTEENWFVVELKLIAE